MENYAEILAKRSHVMDFIIQNIEFILTIIGLIFAVITFFFTKEKKWVSCIIGLLAIACLILVIQYIRTWDYVKVPDVTNIPYSEARIILRSHGFTEYPLTGNNSVLPLDDNAIVIRQIPIAGSQCKENEVINLFFYEGNVSGEAEVIDEVEPTRGEIVHNMVDQPLLTISIENVSFFNNGYHYEYVNPQNPSETNIIDFDTGILGTFSYSRELTTEEKENWMHGGKIYDSEGNEIGYNGNYPAFWSSPDGKFAVQFPKGLQPGEYVYELYQDINNQQVSDKINFIIE